MIGIWGDRTVRSVAGLKNEIETRLYASIKFFVFTLFGSAFMLLGFLGLYFRGNKTFSIPELIELGTSGAFTGTFATLVFAVLFLGFAVKVPMWPHIPGFLTYTRLHQLLDLYCFAAIT